jgi:cytochrome c-type biogenesis protein CcmF
MVALAAFSAAGALVAGIAGIRPGPRTGDWHRGQERRRLACVYLSWTVAILLGGAVLYLALLLQAGDFSMLYVSQHSATYQSALHRFTALVAGKEGSLLFWAFLTGVLSAITAARYMRARSPEDDGPAVHLAVLAVLVLVSLVVLFVHPFRPLAGTAPGWTPGTAPVEGSGLNPVLLNPWAPLHTALTFSAYALITAAFAVGWQQLVMTARGRFADAARWHGEANLWSRWAWLALTLSLLTGFVWAYEEMTFGWFFSWDPVEAAALGVWLVLTAALHVQKSGRGGRAGEIAGPFVTALTMVALLFTAFITRAGLHSGVHAFAGGSAGWFLGGMLLLAASAVGILGALAWRRARDAGRPPAQGDAGQQSRQAALVMLGFAGLIAGGLGLPVASRLLGGPHLEVEPSFFSLWGYLSALGLLFLLGFGWQEGPGRRQAIPLLALFVTLTVLAALIRPSAGMELLAPDRRAGGPISGWLGGISVLSLVPPLVYALLAVAERWAAALRGADLRRRLRETGLAAVHAGAVLALAGVVVSTLFAHTDMVTADPTGWLVSAGRAVGVRVSGIEQTVMTGAHGQVVHERETAKLEVWAEGRIVAAGKPSLTVYPERGGRKHARMLLQRGLLRDTQAIYLGMTDDGSRAVVTVRRIPLVGLLWGGLSLLVPGILLIAGSRYVSEPSPLYRKGVLPT